MAKFLIDENLPEDFELWQGNDFVHVYHLPSLKTDTDIWNYALENNLVIITKDADYYYRCIASSRHPHIIWLRIGNLKKRNLFTFIEGVWDELKTISFSKTLTIVFEDYIEAFD